YLDIAGMLENALAIWHDSRRDFPHLHPLYTVAEQMRRERVLDGRLVEIDRELRKTSRSSALAKRTIANVTSLFVNVS
ncbi:hypothetical protein, partial [Klebsiella pneumoniae]|uniref:hypothetical protein n=1 Tax=Klebsiella pneumoniae TaxID=573 RepID=UPI00301A6CC2